MSESIKCSAKHTAFQGKAGEMWACPKCGATPEAKSGGFLIEEPDGESNSSCNLVHDNDEFLCYECGYRASGKTVAKALMEKANVCDCPLCYGKGTIDKSKATVILTLMDAVNLALIVERAEMQQLSKEGWKEVSMPIQACRNNIEKYKAALRQAGAIVVD